MKKMLLILLVWLPLTVTGQNQPATGEDTATAVVDRYLQLLNIEALPQDSMLVMETTITFYNSKDTIWMRRWYSAPERFRVEVWNGGKLETSFLSNGKDRFRRYMPRFDSWESFSQSDFYDKLMGYDFRGPLYHWREKGATLTWNGTTTLKGQPLNVVKVSCPAMFERYYMFEPESGLLTLIFETDKLYESYSAPQQGHIDWKSIHEYQPLSKSLLPSLESFMREGTLTIMSTQIHLEPLDTDIFEKD